MIKYSYHFNHKQISFSQLIDEESMITIIIVTIINMFKFELKFIINYINSIALFHLIELKLVRLLHLFIRLIYTQLIFCLTHLMDFYIYLVNIH